MWLNEGHSFGITAAGGAGWQLAEWIVEGEPGIDMLAVDPRRFGAYTSKRYVVTEERGNLPQRLHHPLSGRGAPRRAAGEDQPGVRQDRPPAAPSGASATAGSAPTGSRPPGVERRDEWSFRRTNYFEHVGNECRLMRERVGVIDLTPVHQARGHRATARKRGSIGWWPTRCRPRSAGSRSATRSRTRGGIRSEFTITKIGEQHFYVVSAGAAERYDCDYLHRSRCRRTARSACATSPTARGCFVVAGPQVARPAGEAHRYAPLDNARFPVADRPGDRGRGSPVDVYALRVNFVGALGWELHFPIEYAHHLFDALFEAGKEYGIGMVGMRAMESLRMEKSYRMWGSDMTPDYTPVRGGPRPLRAAEQGRVHRPRGARAAARRRRAATASSRWKCMGSPTPIPSATSRSSTGGGNIVGRATSGYYGHCLRKSLAIGYARTDVATPGTELEIEILGERKQATVVPESPYDPENLQLRT